MGVSLLLAGALLAQSAGPIITVEGSVDRVDVGYEELSQNQPEAAIARIQGNKRLESDDPAALINLGAAEVRLGRLAEARSHYRAAMISPERYDLELADGRWMDSRRAARIAEGMLSNGQALALR